MMQQVADSAARAAALADTTSVRPDTLGAPPLPGGVSTLVRAMFSAPTWMWLLLIGAGTAVALFAAWKAWTHRVALWAWVKGRSRGVRIAMIAGFSVLVLGGAGFGAVSWNWMQHDNAFCVSCHVMTPAFQAMQTSSVHDSLQCHDCHSQSVFASMWQLYVWLKDRPEDIAKHAYVPNETCTTCHTGEDETWQRVARTAGHRIHLESDTAALDSVMCTTCHGEEVHRFVPADRTCGQAGCHGDEDTRIVIGPMAAQTALHCVTCHQFTAELPQLASLDSARGSLRPGRQQCFSCHAMQARLAEFNLARDPHGGQCGMCHNPHTQALQTEALKTCTTAGCHDGWRDIPFHTGTAHRRVAQRCETCHQPHAARVDASDCQGCHAEAARRNPRLRNLPQGFDTTQALRRTAWRHEPARPAPHPVALAKRAGKAPAPAPVPADTFEHARHRSLACLTCHRVQGSSRLTFEAPRGCQICHHQAPEQSRCATCHEAGELTATTAHQVAVAVRGHESRTRPVSFRHETHRDLACTACHTAGVGLATPDSVRACAACHDDHHAAGRACATCHDQQVTYPSHAPPVEAHGGCDACHEPATVSRLVPDRALCLTCHAAQRDHEPAGECTTCHFLADPAAYRQHLSGGRS